MSVLRPLGSSALDESPAPAFQRELKGIGAASVKRIEREEGTLYPMYRPAR
jgi:hypothetical protein